MDAEDKNVKKIKLVSCSNGLAEFNVPGDQEGAMFRISGKVQGWVVIVDDIDRVKNPKGSKAAATEGASGTIRINADGTLDVNCSMRMTTARRKNDLHKFSINGATPE